MTIKNRRGRVDPARTYTGVQGPPAEPQISFAVQAQRQEQKADQVQAIGLHDLTEGQVAYDNLVSRGSITAVQRVGRVLSLASITPPEIVVTYTVPNNFVFRLGRFGFQYSEPIQHQLDMQTNLPWRLLINGDAFPGLGEINSLPYVAGPYGIFNQFEVDPVWAKGGDVISIEVRAFAAVTIEVNATGTIGGWLHDRSGLRLGIGV